MWLRRLAVAATTLVGVTLVAFLVVRLVPGDPVDVLLGERGLDPVRHAELLHQLGLDRPLFAQYLDFLARLAHADLGVSLATRTPVSAEFWLHFSATVELSAGALLMGIAAGLPAGLFAAVRRGRPVDRALTAIALAGYSMPIFWWGLLLVMLMSVQLGITPVSGRLSSMLDVAPVTGFMIVDAALSDEPGALRSALSHLVLPCIVLATIPFAAVARVTRAATLEVVHRDFVRALKARGLSPGRILWVHVARNALVPVATVVGLQLGQLLSGAILTETLFSWPGIGKWLVDSVQRRDYPVVQASIVLIAGAVIGVNLLVDALVAWLDPRARATLGA
jgi:dipeptide transport system permease protein